MSQKPSALHFRPFLSSRGIPSLVYFFQVFEFILTWHNYPETGKVLLKCCLAKLDLNYWFAIGLVIADTFLELCVAGISGLCMPQYSSVALHPIEGTWKILLVIGFINLLYMNPLFLKVNAKFHLHFYTVWYLFSFMLFSSTQHLVFLLCLLSKIVSYLKSLVLDLGSLLLGGKKNVILLHVFPDQ